MCAILIKKRSGENRLCFEIIHDNLKVKSRLVIPLKENRQLNRKENNSPYIRFRPHFGGVFFLCRGMICGMKRKMFINCHVRLCRFYAVFQRL